MRQYTIDNTPKISINAPPINVWDKEIYTNDFVSIIKPTQSTYHRYLKNDLALISTFVLSKSIEKWRI